MTFGGESYWVLPPSENGEKHIDGHIPPYMSTQKSGRLCRNVAMYGEAGSAEPVNGVREKIEERHEDVQHKNLAALGKLGGLGANGSGKTGGDEVVEGTI
jgi:hypothetical protein